MPRLFKRRAQVDLLGKSIKDLRIVFNVTSSILSDPNKADIRIYNLTEQSRHVLLSRSATSDPITLDAGYEAISGLVFSGKTTEKLSQKEGVNWVSRIVAEDGSVEQKKKTTLSFRPGVDYGTILEQGLLGTDLAKDGLLAKLRRGDLNGAMGQLSKGFSFSGTVEDLFDKLTKTTEAQWSIQSGEIQALLDRETTRVTTSLSSSTGLVDRPTRSLKKESPGRLFIKGRALMLPSIRPGSRLELDTPDLAGDYKVLSTKATGDTHGTDWFVDFEAISI